MASEAPPPTSLRALDDLALIRRVAEHRQEALATLFDRYAPLLLGLSRRILGPGADAEEVLRETFLQAWAQAPRYDPARASVSAWLVLQTRGRALERRRVLRARAPVAGATRGLAPAASAAEPAPHGGRRESVRAALGGLPDDERQVLEAAFWEGLSRSEIAARFGVPLELVKTRALAAMRRIRHALRDPIRELM